MIIKANSLHIPLKDESVHCVVTSPPYWGLRDYNLDPTIWDGNELCNHEWETVLKPKSSGDNHQPGLNGSQETQAAAATKRDHKSQFCVHCQAWRGQLGLEPTPYLFCQHLVQIFREVCRVLREDGTLWLNLGDCYATGAGKVGERPGGGPQGDKWAGYRGGNNTYNKENRGTSHRMGPMTQPNRMPIDGLKPKDLVMIPSRVTLALQSDGWYLRAFIPWLKRNGMPESVQDRPSVSVEYISLFSKSERYFYDGEAVKLPQSEREMTRRSREAEHGLGSVYSLARDGKTGIADYNKSGCARNAKKKQEIAMRGTRNLRNSDFFFQAWQGLLTDEESNPLAFVVNSHPYKGAHFAVFPERLVDPCIKAGSPPKGVVLDPFSGTGTTLRVAERLGRKAIGLDLGYHDLAKERLRNNQLVMPMR